MLTAEEIKKASPEALKKELAKAQMEKTGIVLKIRMSQSKASHEVKMWKKYIARLLTTKNSKKIEEKTAAKKETSGEEAKKTLAK